MYFQMYGKDENVEKEAGNCPFYKKALQSIIISASASNVQEAGETRSGNHERSSSLSVQARRHVGIFASPETMEAVLGERILTLQLRSFRPWIFRP